MKWPAASMGKVPRFVHQSASVLLTLSNLTPKAEAPLRDESLWSARLSRQCLACCRAGVRAAAYHAGLKDSERARVLQSWSSGQIPVVAATIAFGMGIDRASEDSLSLQSHPS